MLPEENTPRRQSSLVVLHSMGLWLSQTMTWLYTQITSLPHDVENYAVCDRTDNLEQFPYDRLTSADQDGPAWMWLGERSWKIARFRQKRLLQQRADRHGPQVLHSHFGDRGWANIDFAARNRLKHVVSFYGYDASRLPRHEPEWRDRFARLFATADLFLCEGPFLAETLVQLGCPREKARVHHLGVPVDQIRYENRDREPGEPLRVLIAGSFLEKKGIPNAIEALGMLGRKSDIELTIIGDSNGQERSDNEKQRIIDALDQTGLAANTRMLGYRPHAELMREAYRNHVFLSPSITATDGDSEGGAPVSLIEMAASGILVISSLHCDIPNVIRDGESGLLAEEGDVQGVADKLTWAIENPDQWTRITSCARARVELEFDCRSLATGLADHYRTLADE